MMGDNDSPAARKDKYPLAVAFFVAVAQQRPYINEEKSAIEETTTQRRGAIYENTALF
jgi:hypothetical protein